MPRSAQEVGEVAICMATYNPDEALFTAQVESIRAQQGVQWHCFISDDRSDPVKLEAMKAVIGGDPRMTISISPTRLGFYRNFERAIGMVPHSYELLALSDQDDVWNETKLSTLVDQLGNAQLIYSDQRLVTEDGSIISDTYWTTRQNNFTNITSLLIANTVTGAASLFRRSVVEKALPFPEVPGDQYHDHWLAMIALAIGDINYVDQPLYDYVQHSNAVLGHEKANEGLARNGWRRLKPGKWREILGGWASAYFDVFLRLKAIDQIVLERCEGEISKPKLRDLQRFARSDRSATGFVWLATRPLRRLAGHSETMGIERVLARGVLYRHLAGVKRRLPRSVNEKIGAGGGLESGSEFTSQMRQKVSPLFPVISKNQPARVNLLIPTIDLEHLFGGYIAKFNLARRLAESGLRVRIVTVDPTPPLPKDWRSQVESFSQLGGLFDQVEICFARDGREPFLVSPDDRFIATTWWTAHIASRLTGQTSSDRFLYMIQEYEPLTVPDGAWTLLAEESYGFSHDALFSTAMLRDYFADNAIGVFRDGVQSGNDRSLTFRNAITPIEAPAATELEGRKSPKLIFYGRPESHAARNLYEVGIEALRAAVAEGLFGDEWSFHGIGSVGSATEVDLGAGRFLELKPRTGQMAYGEFLAGHDLGVALMDAPHPSLVPIEMASAGMLVITTTYGGGKTAERLAEISPNLIGVSPCVQGVLGGLRTAVNGIGEFSSRSAGAAVDWPCDWDVALDDDLTAHIRELLSLS